MEQFVMQKNIVQFQYNDDGMDPIKIEKQFINYFNDLWWIKRNIFIW